MHSSSILTKNLHTAYILSRNLFEQLNKLSIILPVNNTKKLKK